MSPSIPEQAQFVELHFPAAGIDLSSAFMQQPNKPVGPQQIYARSTPVGVNVRGYESLTLRVRGGSRAGLAKYIPSAPVDGWIIQELNVIVLSENAAVTVPPSGVPIAPPPMNL